MPGISAFGGNCLHQNILWKELAQGELISRVQSDWFPKRSDLLKIEVIIVVVKEPGQFLAVSEQPDSQFPSCIRSHRLECSDETVKV